MNINVIRSEIIRPNCASKSIGKAFKLAYPLSAIDIRTFTHTYTIILFFALEPHSVIDENVSHIEIIETLMYTCDMKIKSSPDDEQACWLFQQLVSNMWKASGRGEHWLNSDH